MLSGLTPAYFRWSGRQSLEQYHTVNMTNGTVTRIDMARNSFTVHADLPGRQGQAVTSRKVVLGTGIRDLVPDTPGLRENWARGIYWCPWCDGHEHAGQPLGLLSTLDEIPSMVREIYTLNNDLVAFVNGSDTPPNRAALQQENAQWQVYLALQNVTVVNATLESIERLRGEAVATGPQPTGPAPDDDLFRVHVAGGASFERSAIFTSFPKQQASMVGPQMGVRLEDVSMVSDPERGLMTNIDGVYAVGDANSDSSTNVPHALYSGKKAAVYIHCKCTSIHRRRKRMRVREGGGWAWLCRVDGTLRARELAADFRNYTNTHSAAFQGRSPGGSRWGVAATRAEAAAEERSGGGSTSRVEEVQR